MPALIICGYRSRIGSDDLYCPAFLLFLYQIPLINLSLIYICFIRHCATMTFTQTSIPFWFTLVAIPINVFMACIYLMIVHISSKGTIIAQERRVLMPRILQIQFIWSIVDFLYSILGIYLWFYQYDEDMCYPDSNFVLAVSAPMCTQHFVTLAFGFCVLAGVPQNAQYIGAVERNGNVDTEHQTLLDEHLERSLPMSDVYIPHRQEWVTSLRRLCSCIRCLTCNLFGGAGAHHESISVVANVFARLFYGSPDLVISDIVAGFILLTTVQKHEELLQQEKEDQKDHELLVKSIRKRMLQRLEQTTPSVSIVDADVENVISSIPHTEYDLQALEEVANLRDETLEETVIKLAHYSKFAVGIYGWILYVWSHPWMGTFRLAFGCMKQSTPYIYGDNRFHLNQLALQLETGAHTDDIIYASFRNFVYRPAFCVIADHARKEIVLSVRGTLSLEDCLTDAIAYGMSMDKIAERLNSDGKGEYAHQGFLHTAEAMHSELSRLNILEMLFDPKFKWPGDEGSMEFKPCTPGEYHDYQLVLTGHSLGAATAVLLGVMLKPLHPKLHVYAISPPGCVMSPGLAERCSEYVTTVVVGFDIVARASLTSAEALRDQVIDLISRSKVSKTNILGQVVAWRDPSELLLDYGEVPSEIEPSLISHHLSDYQSMLRNIQDSQPINELSIPGTVVHLKRRRTEEDASGCWVCCRPGGGGVCCTVRKNYKYGWAEHSRFKNIRLSRTMLDDHFPDKVHYVLQDCESRIQKRARRRRSSRLSQSILSIDKSLTQIE